MEGFILPQSLLQILDMGGVVLPPPPPPGHIGFKIPRLEYGWRNFKNIVVSNTRNRLKLSNLVGENFEIYAGLKMLKMYLNRPPWLEKILKYVSQERQEIHYSHDTQIFLNKFLQIQGFQGQHLKFKVFQCFQGLVVTMF